MADKTINQLTQATALTDSSLFVIEQNSTAKQANWGMMKNYISPGVAAQYSSSATYDVGDYCIYNGSLYRCTTAITTAESWTAAHWTAVALGDDVSDLKSALHKHDVIENNLFNAGEITEGYFITPTGTINSSDVWGYVVIPVTSGTKYSISGGGSIVCYYVGNTPAGSGDTDEGYSKVITIPDSVTRMSVSVYLANKDVMQVVQSSSVVLPDWSALKNYNNVIHPATYTNYLPDANKTQKNTVYRFFGFTQGAASIPTNLPFNKWPVGTNDEAFLVDLSDISSDLYREQFLFGKFGIFSRSYSASYGAWYGWEIMFPVTKVVEVDVSHPGTKDYDSLTKAIIENQDNKNVKIIVYPGEYNMISELEEIYGSGYLDTISERWFGCTYLSNGVHIVFAEDALVKCEYTGNNTYVRNYFSPFNAGVGGFILENLNISCSGVRHCVHDECGDYADVYQNYYLNCQMFKDSENGAIQQQCIGGGLGINGQIIIKDCYFDGDKTDGQTLVSYHNAVSASARSKIVVNGCYFAKKGRLRFAHYGNSLKKTMCIASNNSFGADIEIAYETTAYHNENMEVIAWGNVVRT